MRRCSLLTLALALGLAPLAADETAQCLTCHDNANMALRDAGGKVRSLFVDPPKFYGSVHARKGCLACHGNLGLGPHGDALGKLPPLDARYAPLLRHLPRARQVALANCFGCHPTQLDTYQGSVHAQQVAKGSLDAPLCDDCHGAHAITGKEDPESPINPDKVPATCASCHAQRQVMARYDVSTNVVQTFESHFHARKRMIGDTRAAVCTSCHGTHRILGPKDPKSTVNPANVQATCAQDGCHPGKGAAFAASFKHQVPSTAVEPIVYLVKHVHEFMMVLVLGTMFLHIFLDVLRRKLNEARAAQAAKGGH
jgi:nitrate/TMAO reductase-like tetraheme cytochrome c subunit